jgi:sporulation protein YlmC with PRC-barrel domain
MEEADHRADNPYTAIEGYAVFDSSGTEIGEIEVTVYDSPSDVLKYVVVDGRPIPAEAIVVDAAEQRVSIPYDAEAVESAPEMEEPSGAFDDAVREHYEGRSLGRPNPAEP